LVLKAFMIKLLYFNPRRLPKRCDIQRVCLTRVRLKTASYFRPDPKPQSRSEVDFFRFGPLTGRVFTLSVNTHVTYYTKLICIVLKTRPKPAMSGDIAFITPSLLEVYESILGSALNLRLKLQISESEGYIYTLMQIPK